MRPGQKWAEPDADHAARQMRAMKDDPAECAKRAAAARHKVQTEFSEAAIGQRYAARIHQILDDLEKNNLVRRASGSARPMPKGDAA